MIEEQNVNCVKKSRRKRVTVLSTLYEKSFVEDILQKNAK